MVLDTKEILKTLDINTTGNYENQFYVIPFANSDEYSVVYTKLNKHAINTEYPAVETNSSGTTTKIINYFELTCNDLTYNLFLIADFANDKYYLKIGEK